MLRDKDLEREEAEWGHTPGQKAAGGKPARGRRSGSSHRAGSASRSPSPPVSSLPNEAHSKLAESSPDVSEDESAVSALSNLRSGGHASSDLYHKYRYGLKCFCSDDSLSL